MTPDVNVLVAASRDDHPHHGTAFAWLEQTVAAANVSPLTLQGMVIASFLRLVTSPRVFPQPTPTADALRFIDALLDAPGVHYPLLGAEWPQLRKMCAEQALTADDLPDAWLAAAVIEQGEHLVSFDAGFRRLLPRSQFTRLPAGR